MTGQTFAIGETKKGSYWWYKYLLMEEGTMMWVRVDNERVKDLDKRGVLFWTHDRNWGCAYN